MPTNSLLSRMNRLILYIIMYSIIILRYIQNHHRITTAIHTRRYIRIYLVSPPGYGVGTKLYCMYIQPENYHTYDIIIWEYGTRWYRFSLHAAHTLAYICSSCSLVSSLWSPPSNVIPATMRNTLQ